MTKKIALPTLSLRGFSIPVSGLFSGVAGGILGYTIFSLYGSSRLSGIQKDIVLGAKSLPLWSNLRNAVNPDRAFFELADDKHNEPLIFHSGLYLLNNLVPLMLQLVLSLTKSSVKFLTNLTLSQPTTKLTIDLDDPIIPVNSIFNKKTLFKLS